MLIRGAFINFQSVILSLVLEVLHENRVRTPGKFLTRYMATVAQLMMKGLNQSNAFSKIPLQRPKRYDKKDSIRVVKFVLLRAILWKRETSWPEITTPS
jgi:hypothetical protein